LGFVFERERLGRVLDEEVERIDHREVGNQVNGDIEDLGGLREHEPGHEVAEGVLLPVDEVIARLDLEAVREDRRARVRGGPQPHHVRVNGDGSIEAIGGAMLDADVDSHAKSYPDRRSPNPSAAGWR